MSKEDEALALLIKRARWLDAELRKRDVSQHSIDHGSGVLTGSDDSHGSNGDLSSRSQSLPAAPRVHQREAQAAEDHHIYTRPLRPVRIRYRICPRNKIMVWKYGDMWRVTWRGKWPSSRIHNADLITYVGATLLVAYLLRASSDDVCVDTDCEG